MLSFSILANSGSSWCRIGIVRKYGLKSCWYRLICGAVVDPCLGCGAALNNGRAPTGDNCAKSPNAITGKPPKYTFGDVIAFISLSRRDNVFKRVLLTVEISSTITKMVFLWAALNALSWWGLSALQHPSAKPSLDTGTRMVELIVDAFAVLAATPVKAITSVPSPVVALLR